MGHVTVTVNGRTFRLRCGDGEEPRLLELAAQVRDRVDRLALEFGQIGDERLSVMAAILITDELMDARAQIEHLTASLALAEQVIGAEHAAQPPLPHQLPQDMPPIAPAGDPAPAAMEATPAPEPDTAVRRTLRRPVARQTALSDRLADIRDSSAD